MHISSSDIMLYGMCKIAFQLQYRTSSVTISYVISGNLLSASYDKNSHWC